MVPLEDAQATVLAACSPLVLTPRAQPLAEALGCVLASEITAGEDVPPFANTAMDGYAVRSVDTVAAPVPLVVIGTVAAGGSSDRLIGPGEAMRIMTGAPMPPGADAVVMVEKASLVPGSGSEQVIVESSVAAGENVRHAGEDFPAGAVVFETGAILTPAHIGVLASLGCDPVEVFPRARVGVLSTGDELVSGPVALARGQIRDSNRPALLALLRQSGFVSVDLGVVPDDFERITDAVKRGLSECDALVTSGGVSVGDFDYMKDVLDRLGTMHWWQVAIKPAKPFAFGVIDGTPVFGLPGNPVSSMVSYELFARPALRLMSGHSPGDLHRPQVAAVADEDLRRKPDGKVHFMRVVAHYEAGDSGGRYHVRPSGGQGSHMLRAMASANALAVVPDGGTINAGETVTTLLLGSL